MENTGIAIFEGFKAVSFKSEGLNKATAEIGQIAELAKGAALNQATAEREITLKLGAVLHRVESGKLYKADGFKSLAEYAERIGLNKAKAHSLAVFGGLQASDAPESIKALPYAKSDALASMLRDKDTRKAVYDNADALGGMTQAQIRDWVKSNRPASDKPAPVYAALHKGVYIKGEDKKPVYKTLEDWHKTHGGEAVRITKDTLGRVRFVYIKDNGACDLYTYTEPEKPEKKPAKPVIVDDEQAAAMLGCTVEQFRAFKASIGK